MTRPRPKNLNLFTIHFPAPAIISILHRISGFLLFLLVPFALWALDYSLTASGFDSIQQWLAPFYIKFLLWLLWMPLCFHLIAGIRHLLVDIHIGESLAMGRLTSWLTFVISALLIVLAGIWLW